MRPRPTRKADEAGGLSVGKHLYSGACGTCHLEGYVVARPLLAGNSYAGMCVILQQKMATSVLPVALPALEFDPAVIVVGKFRIRAGLDAIKKIDRRILLGRGIHHFAGVLVVDKNPCPERGGVYTPDVGGSGHVELHPVTAVNAHACSRMLFGEGLRQSVVGIAGIAGGKADESLFAEHGEILVAERCAVVRPDVSGKREVDHAALPLRPGVSHYLLYAGKDTGIVQQRGACHDLGVRRYTVESVVFVTASHDTGHVGGVPLVGIVGADSLEFLTGGHHVLQGESVVDGHEPADTRGTVVCEEIDMERVETDVDEPHHNALAGVGLRKAFAYEDILGGEVRAGRVKRRAETPRSICSTPGRRRARRMAEGTLPLY